MLSSVTHDSFTKEVFFLAIANNDFNIINRCLEEVVDLYSVDREGNTGLHLAVKNYKKTTNLINLLLGKRANIEARDNNGKNSFTLYCS